jgi:hypothetical protein
MQDIKQRQLFPEAIRMDSCFLKFRLFPQIFPLLNHTTPTRNEHLIVFFFPDNYQSLFLIRSSFFRSVHHFLWKYVELIVFIEESGIGKRKISLSVFSFYLFEILVFYEKNCSLFANDFFTSFHVILFCPFVSNYYHL